MLSFTLIDIRGEQPDLAALTRPAAARSNAATLALATPGDDGALGRTFKALVNYLEELYLSVALEKAVTQFPELTNAAITGPETVGERLRYSFERAIGSKG